VQGGLKFETAAAIEILGLKHDRMNGRSGIETVMRSDSRSSHNREEIHESDRE
jgi:hypothetical protein